MDWWNLAGLHSLVSETPAGWLEAPASNDNRPKRRAEAQVEAAPPPLPEILLKKEEPQTKEKAPITIPEDWDAFQNWLATDPQVPGAQWDGRRLLPEGKRQSALMIITAWPEMDDHRAGHHYSGDVGVLLGNMLKAIGLTRSQCYITSLAITRPAGGRCPDGEVPDLQKLLAHHINLADPQHILLVGGDIVQLMLGQRLQMTRGRLLEINQNDRNYSGVAIPHPAMLLTRPAYKAAAWDSLKLLIQRD